MLRCCKRRRKLNLRLEVQQPSAQPATATPGPTPPARRSRAHAAVRSIRAFLGRLFRCCRPAPSTGRSSGAQEYLISDDFGHVEEGVAGNPAPEYQISVISPYVVEAEEAGDSGHVVEVVAGDPAPGYQLSDASPRVHLVEENEEADVSGYVVEEVAGTPAPGNQLSDASPHVDVEEEEAGPSGIQTIRTPLTVDSFKFHQFLGHGAFGKVYLASHRASDQQLAIKMVRKRAFLKKDPEVIFRESQALKTLKKGPFITQLYGTFQSEDYLYFAMEYLSGGDLSKLIDDADVPFDITTLRLFAAQMVIGLEYIHSKGIIHRDIKPENILLDGVGNIKIADFGLAAQNVFGNAMTKGCKGTLFYMAPEVFLEMDYNHTVDYFSMGIVLFIMASFRYPFLKDEEDRFDFDLRSSICCTSPDYTAEMDIMLKDFLKKLLCKSQIRREKLVKNLREEPLFIQIDWKDVESGEARPPFHVEPPQEKPRDTLTVFEITYSEAKRKPRLRAEQQQLFKSFSFASEGW
ncbi:protein kinase C theta type-like [Hyperolius riggenbachi]|uniref:protein kinase C theta type-like n=2 Tax=Hyperolius riggenbachi TaxID=752182 RepID=UPI0035A360B9